MPEASQSLTGPDHFQLWKLVSPRLLHLPGNPSETRSLNTSAGRELPYQARFCRHLALPAPPSWQVPSPEQKTHVFQAKQALKSSKNNYKKERGTDSKFNAKTGEEDLPM